MSDSEIPEDEMSPEELAEAAELASEVDTLLHGKGRRDVVRPQQELLRTAAMIHAAHHEQALAPDRRASLIEAAMSQATGADQARFASSASATTSATTDAAASAPTETATNDLDRARAKRRRRLIVGTMSLVAAAAVFFLVWREQGDPATGIDRPVAMQMQLHDNERSRASDQVVGQIAPTQSGLASKRIAQVYSDRMSGYRSLQYRRLGSSQ